MAHNTRFALSWNSFKILCDRVFTDKNDTVRDYDDSIPSRWDKNDLTIY